MSSGTGANYYYLPAQTTATVQENILGYQVVSPAGIIGLADDLIVDEDTREIVALIVDTMNIFPENNLLVPSQAISAVDSADSYLYVTLTVREIREHP